jgi:hypothetical protein
MGAQDDLRKETIVRKTLTVAVMAGLLIASSCGDDEGDLPVKQIAQRVENIRGLKFERVPEVRLLGEEEFAEESTKVARASAAAQKIDLAQVKRNLAVARQLIFITGLLTPDEIAQATSGGADLAGLYSFKTNELLVLDKGSRRSREGTVAHELTHALEDQALGSRLTTTLNPLSDRAAAYQSLLEGSATLVQIRYGQRYLGARGGLEHRLAEVERKATSSTLPEMLAAATVFPYVQGARFARALERQGGWKLIDRAHRHPPTTTSSVIHPDRFLAGERTVAPHLGAASGLDDTWTKLGSLALGEFDTLLLLKSGVSDSDADTIAAGWAGGTVDAYRHGRPGDCEAPCRDKVVLRTAWTWRSPSAARAFAKAMPEWFTRALSAQGHDSWELDGGAAALSVRGRETRLVFAPTARMARALAAG